MSDYAIELRDVVKRFGGVVASDRVNIQVERGKIFGIIGPNGAGKTTLFNMITGVFAPDEGDIIFENKSIVGMLPNKISDAGIARTFQNIRLFENLSVYQNLHIAYQSNMDYSIFDGIVKTRKYREQESACAARCEEILRNVGLWELKDQLASNLPYGQQRRLEIARALASSPTLLLLDEPAAGMNEEESMRLTNIIRKTRNDHDNLTILIIDHHMDLIMDVCDVITVINFGKQLATGTPEEIQNNPEVIEAYLGADD